MSGHDLYTFHVRDINAVDLGGMGTIQTEMGHAPGGRFPRSTLVANVRAGSTSMADEWLRAELLQRQATWSAIEFMRVSSHSGDPPHTLTVGKPTRGVAAPIDFARNYLRSPELTSFKPQEPAPRPPRCIIQLFSIGELAGYRPITQGQPLVAGSGIELPTPGRVVIAGTPSPYRNPLELQLWRGRSDRRF